MNAWQSAIWGQFGAAIDALGNTVRECPEEVWGDRSREPEFWMLAHHTVFYLDLYLSDGLEGWAPPSPFALDELEWDPPRREHPYAKEDVLRHVAHCRRKCRTSIAALTAERAEQPCAFPERDLSVLGLLLYNMRHVQHHHGQLNATLRQTTGSATPWVSRAADG